MRHVISSCIVAFACAAVSAQTPWRDTPVQTLDTRGAPAIEATPLGSPARQAQVTLGETFLNTSGARVQMLVRKTSRDAREFDVVTLNLHTGSLKIHDTLKGYGQAKTTWSGGRLYWTTWLPGGMYEYDPASDAIKSLGMPFENHDLGGYRMSVSPDGVISLGGGGVSEVSMYDPATGKIAMLGVISDKHAWVYSLGSDNDYIYAALRGKAPWELVAINKKTHEKKVLVTVPQEGYIEARRTHAWVSENLQGNAERKNYMLNGTQITLFDPNAIKPDATPKAAPPPPLPKVLIDQTPLLQGSDSLALHYQNPDDLTQWKQAALAAPLYSEATLAIAALPDGRVAAMSGPYGPALLYDPATDKTVQARFDPVSGRCLAAAGAVLYGSGYPTTVTMRWDTRKPITSPDDLPGQPGLPFDNPNANPRSLGAWPQTPTSGGHMGVRLFVGADECIYICTARHRHNSGFDVVWYDPKTDQKGEIDDQGLLDHRKICWAAAIDGATKLIISTALDPNGQLTSPMPTEGMLFAVDLASRKYEQPHTPLPGARKYTGIVEVAPGVVVGLAPADDSASTYIYRYDLANRKLERVTRYAGLIHGVAGTTALPAKGQDFVMGPDGKIWTGMGAGAGQSMLLRIDPRNLTVTAIGTLAGGHVRFAFVGDTVYACGETRIRKLTLP